MDTTFAQLYDEFISLANSGDEAKTKEFIFANFKKFPESLQDELTFIFFEKAILDKADKVRTIAGVQKEGLKAMSQIEKAKKALEDEAKIQKIKADLGKSN